MERRDFLAACAGAAGLSIASPLSAQIFGRRVALLSRAGPYAGFDLALDFKNGIYRSQNTVTRDVTALPGYSYARAGAKYELDANGTPILFAPNVPGIVSGLGYWARSAVTNYVASSADFSVWGGLPTGLAANSGTAPNGASVATSWTGGGRLFYEAGSSNGQYTGSIFVKTLSGSPTLGAYIKDRASDTLRATAVLAASSAWQRLSATGTTAGASPGFRFEITVSGGTVLLWQGQTVDGPQAGPVIVTTSSQATVAGDAPVVPDTVASEDQVFLVSVNIPDLSVAGNLLEWSDGGPNNRLVIYITGGGLTFFSNSANSAQTMPSPVATSAGAQVVALRRRSGKWTAGVRKTDGSIVIGAEGGATTFPAGITRVTPGTIYSSAAQLNGTLGSLMRKRGTFSDAELAALLAGA